MTNPVYPRALSSWVDRLNNIDTIWASDPNTLAAEIISIEQTLGTMPQVEALVPVGNPLTYNSVSARISDAMLDAQHPYVELKVSHFKIPDGTQAQPRGGINAYTKYNPVSDNWGYFNGSDITTRADGLYYVHTHQAWENYTSGWLHHLLIINGTEAGRDKWSWDQSTSGPSPGSYAGKWAYTSVDWIGTLHKGQRVRVVSVNGTNKTGYEVMNSDLRMYYLRNLPS